MGAKKSKPTPEPTSLPGKPTRRAFDPRDNLGLFLQHPEKNLDGLVIEWDDEFVVVADKYPKAR